jgi:hypothetical protein
MQWTCCSSGVCRAQNEWYWQCVPAVRSVAHNPFAARDATTLEVEPPAAVDDLQIAAPAVVPVGAPVTITALLTRGAVPVAGEAVSFAITTPGTDAGGGDASVAMVSGPVVQVTAMTGLDGTASVVLPPSAGITGASSIVTASVDGGKAAGARGTVSVMSPDAVITWQ